MKGYASLRLSGDELDYFEISKMLDLKPDDITHKGEVRALKRVVEFDSFAYASRMKRRSPAPDKPFDYLAKKIQLWRHGGLLPERLAALGVTETSIAILMDGFATHGVFQIKRRHMQLAVDLNARLFFDLWRNRWRASTDAHGVETLAENGGVHLYYASDSPNYGFTLEMSELVRYLRRNVEPIVHVW